ncbi:hypothetical protein [Adhaeribacter soli]|uniref:Collagen-like protein n=1 Tax=Adhaeribacter soli TaxID=2607655 RepID=A0A5N1J4K3_9BACT|nr:hypothetical protein [Adhaeribacter soli]KAA9345836.1 hypothetical protein F0P94_01770 [Adhaeribacter soli]
MKKLFYLFFLLAFTSCTINESDTPGPIGPPGPAGAPGHTNVVSTEPILLRNWTYNTQYRWFAADVNVPELTPDIVDAGLVMVYQQINGGQHPVWIPLPDTYGNVTTNYEFYDGGITIYTFNVDNTIPLAPGEKVIRIVVIPPGLKKANPNTNWHNFQEAKAVLKLAD